MTRRDSWRRTRLKYVADCNRVVLSENTPDHFEFTYIDISSVTQGSVNIDSSPIRFADAPSRARRIAEPGDSVVSTVRTYLRAVATVPQSADPLVFSTGFAVLHPRGDVSTRFLAYYLQGDDFVDRVVAHSTGVSYPAITARDLMDLSIDLPPLHEQRRIADFLDAETAQIDVLIAEQERFIDLLGERRSTELDLKIPLVGASAWPTDKLGRWADVRSGSTPRRDNDAYWRDGNFPWLSSAAVNLPSVNSAEEFVTEKAVRECNLPIVEPGSLLIGLIGQGPTRGLTTITRIKSTLSQNLAFIAPDRSRWLPEYLLWSLRASYQEIRQRGAESGAAQGMLNTDDIRRHRLVRPPMHEQRRIAEELESATARIDGLIAEAEHNIVLSRERRAALITTAVTGSIDVSTAA